MFFILEINVIKRIFKYKIVNCYKNQTIIGIVDTISFSPK